MITTDLFGKYWIIQKRFKFQTKIEAILLITGGVILSLSEFILMSSIFPLIMFILNPNAALSFNFLKEIYLNWNFSSNASFVMFLILVVVFMLFAKVLINIGLWKYEFIVLNRWRNKISHEMFNTVVSSNYQRLLSEDSASLINIVSGVIPYVVENYLFNWIAILQTLFTAIILFILLALLSPFAMVIAFIISGFLIFTFLSIRRKKAFELGKSSELERTKIISILQMAISGHKDTIINGKQAFFLSRFNFHSAAAAKVDLTLKFIQALPGMLIEFITLTTIFVVFFFLVYVTQDVQGASLKIIILVITGFRMIPIINRSITCITFMKSAYEPIAMVINLHDKLKTNKNNSDGFSETNVLSNPLSFNNEIKIENLHFKYNEDAKILNNINITIPKGSHFGFVGASGSGKTTLINIILTFLTDYQGVITVDGQSINKQNYRNFREMLGFVDQQPFILNGSLAENVAFGLPNDEIDEERVTRALKDVGLDEVVKNSEFGINLNVGENGKYLSGGQRQRLAMARALYKDVAILVLDEATSSLDMQSETEIARVLDKLKGKLTIISVAHRLSTLKNCDCLHFISNGNIEDRGSFSDLYKTNKTFRQYVDQANLNIEDNY